MSRGIIQRTVDGDEIGFLQNGIEVFQFYSLRSLLNIGVEGNHFNAKGSDSPSYIEPDSS